MAAQKQWQWQSEGTSWKGVAIYHLTLTLPTREPLLGHLTIPDNDPAKAQVVPTELGRALLESPRSVPTFHPEIQILQYCLMPDHLHSIWVQAAEHGDTQALRNYMNGCILAARSGTIMVSPFISPKERDVMAVLLRERHPFIVLADNGFRDYYKPPAHLFDAVAEGRVLILSPWQHDAAKRHISRADCVALNNMAAEIAAM